MSGERYRLTWASSLLLQSFFFLLYIFSILFFLLQVRFWQPSWIEVVVTGHNFESILPKDHPCHVCFKLADWFQKRRLLFIFILFWWFYFIVAIFFFLLSLFFSFFIARFTFIFIFFIFQWFSYIQFVFF
jgi:hypothetical protein